MASEVLKEFLVRLGFRIDETSERKFNDSLDKVSKGALGFGSAIAGVVTGAEAMAAKVAASGAQLAYVSQATGVPVKNLQALQYAYGQVGLNADEAIASQSRFAMAMRMNPALQGVLQGFGIQGRDPSEQWRNLLHYLKDFSQTNGPAAFNVASQFGQMFGMSADELLRLSQNIDQVDHAIDAYTRKQDEAGVGSAEASQQMVEFNQSVSGLEGSFHLFEQRIFADVAPSLKHLIDLATWLLDAFNRADKATGGWLGTLGSLAASLLSVWKIGSLLTMLLRRGLGIEIAKDAAKEVAKKVAKGAVEEVVEGAAKEAAEDVTQAVTEGVTKEVVKDVAGTAAREVAGAAVKQGMLRGLLGRLALNPVVAGAMALFHSEELNTGEEAYLAARRGPGAVGAGGEVAAGGAAGGKVSGGAAGAGGALAPEQAKAILTRAGVSPLIAEGMVANFQRESGLKPGAVGDRGQAYGFGQWHTDRQANFRRLFGINIRQATAEQQLQFAAQEILQGQEHGKLSRLMQARTAGEAGGLYSTLVERPADIAGEAQRRAQLADILHTQLGAEGRPAGGTEQAGAAPVVTQSNQTTIHVTSPASAEDIARHVAVANRQHHAQLLRNVKSAVTA